MQTRVPTRKEFEEMAARGRLHKDDSFIPSDSDLDDAPARTWSPLRLFRRRHCALLRLHWRKHAIAYSEYVRDFEHAKVPPSKPQPTSRTRGQ
jgi:hypothetical protein